MSGVFAFRKFLFAAPPAFRTAGLMLDWNWLGEYMESPPISTVVFGLKRPVLSSIDSAHFAPESAKAQYPRGEQRVHSP